MSDYLSTTKRTQVEEMKRRIIAGEFNTPGAGYITATSTTVGDVIGQAIYQDEQGPWSVEDDHTELELAQYELALAAELRKAKAEALKEAADAVGDPMLHDGDKVATLAEVKAWLNACADAYRADEMEGEG